MAVAVPIYFATRSRARAFSYSFLSGLAEPLGAIIGFTLLKPFLSPFVFGIVLGCVAGIMVYISVDELLPAAQQNGEHHIGITGLIAGMAVMAASLLMLT
jgi:ZIP family zinc transporter